MFGDYPAKFGPKKLEGSNQQSTDEGSKAGKDQNKEISISQPSENANVRSPLSPLHQQPIVVPPQLLPAQPVQAAPLQPPQAAQPAIPNIVITPPPLQRSRFQFLSRMRQIQFVLRN